MHFTCLLPLLLADVNEVAWQLPGLFVGDDSDATLHGNVGSAQVVGSFNLDEMLTIFRLPCLLNLHQTPEGSVPHWAAKESKHIICFLWCNYIKPSDLLSAYWCLLCVFAASKKDSFAKAGAICHISRSEMWPTSSCCHLSWLACAQRPPGSLLWATWQLSQLPLLGGNNIRGNDSSRCCLVLS